MLKKEQDKKFIIVDKNKNKFNQTKIEKLLKTKETWQSRVENAKQQSKMYERDVCMKMKDDLSFQKAWLQKNIEFKEKGVTQSMSPSKLIETPITPLKVDQMGLLKTEKSKERVKVMKQDYSF